MAAVGVLLPTREAAILERTDASDLLDFARAAEDAGFDSVWAGDSLTARPRPEPLTLLSAVAAACTRVTLGTAALTGSLRQPLLAAHAIATLDQVASGRLILALGSGFPYPETQAEFDVAGARFDQRVGRMLETVRLWRTLWDPERDPGAPLRFEGKYWHFDGIEGVTRPTQQGGPPLWLAGAGEKALQHVGKHFDGWLPYLPEASDYARSLSDIKAVPTAPRPTDHPFTPALYVTVNLQADPRKARTELAGYVQDYYGLPLDIMETLQAFFAGRPDWAAEWLKDYLKVGAQHVVVRVGSLDWRSQLETVATSLLPALRAV